MNAGARRALFLFHKAAEEVPAYRDFLKKNKINHEKIKNSSDFGLIPWTDKKNYITNYPLQARTWGGRIEKSSLVAVSSGTTGAPTFWPRGYLQESEAAVIHELIYRYLFRIDRHRTLLLIGFPMGVYVSGIATLLPSLAVANKCGMTVVSVGNNKQELLRVVRSLAPDYDQIVLVGHPFFIKDVVETGKEDGFPWAKKRLRMMFCSEGFSEEWRQYVLREAGMSSSETIISTYGASEFLLIGHETPFTIALREKLEEDRSLQERIMEDGPLPSLFQYNPLFRFIEAAGNELLFTSASGLPLIRFNLHDSGRIISLKEIRNLLPRAPRPRWNLPLVALKGRSDRTVIFYAANIYPEHIHAALNHAPLLKKITGKFVMRKDYWKNMDEYLEINVELRHNAKGSDVMKRQIETHLVKILKEINMEYLFLCNNLEKDLRPRVVLWPYQSEKYFKAGMKPKYI